MTNPECPRELELFDAIRAAQWPELAPAELRAHTASCAACNDLATVANALFVDFTDTVRSAAVPPPGAVWWRAQRRARQEAVRNATRTVTAVQLISVIAATVVAAAILGTMSITSVDWPALAHRFSAALPVIAVHWTMPLLLAMGACAALAPVAVYLAVARD
jgi:predicted anti-sigma-YlaC factor YlaD